jgi:hypothetical protein
MTGGKNRIMIYGPKDGIYVGVHPWGSLGMCGIFFLAGKDVLGL